MTSEMETLAAPTGGYNLLINAAPKTWNSLQRWNISKTRASSAQHLLLLHLSINDRNITGGTSIFERHALSRLKSYIKVDCWGRSCMFLLICTVWRMWSQQVESWNCLRTWVQIKTNWTGSTFSFSFVYGVIVSRLLLTEHSCVSKMAAR